QTELLKAARLSGVEQFVGSLPQGYDYQVGEGGCNLSGGQRQRIAIARALIANPAILILDEATSALDYASEAHIQRNLSLIGADRTVLIVAHRLSSVRDCDQILVLDAGRVVDRGTHAELLARDGLYSDLWRLQTEGFSSKEVRYA
ncbi:MAG: ATP-binding cassette domain-containing protein, partial [Oceanospirillaceae bacterium]|nr:ATP-binding cassette domain-containing protein [Oceanospirillaceae bacterium]